MGEYKTNKRRRYLPLGGRGSLAPRPLSPMLLILCCLYPSLGGESGVKRGSKGLFLPIPGPLLVVRATWAVLGGSWLGIAFEMMIGQPPGWFSRFE